MALTSDTIAAFQCHIITTSIETQSSPARPHAGIIHHIPQI